MTEKILLTPLEALGRETVRLDEDDLAAPWSWGSYGSEGLRFAYFRLLEELDLLRARLAGVAARPESRRILAGYNRAYWDLQAITLGVSDEAAVQAPGKDEWDIRRTYAHILGADYGFYAVAIFALEAHRAGSWSEEKTLTDPDYDRILEMTEAEYNDLMEGELSLLTGAHRNMHTKVMAGMSAIRDEELDLPSKYWEEELYPLRFRLGRFASHLRQHSIQIEKTRPTVGLPISEAELILRQIYRLYADIETLAPEPDPGLCAPSIKQIQAIQEAIP